ncbi:MAG: hypothetical protein EOR00_29685 [Mesorhizobium sp.]|uniref:hypothetical protein n=1 Tax=Mesorhizobium sp. TaxID=1871066 RepID=UPI000FE5AA7C|nr:hypothetical protein [Mesorhizobium sp.]RWP10966.1 MAG: hypothetical protein EOR00_29685 [Mesorhizobium sp.]
MKPIKPADDPRFHYEIWTGPTEAFGDQPKAIYYVENHNASCGYAELATDFRLAAAALIETYRASQLGNWVTPVAHLVRQTLELELKALYSAVLEHDSAIDQKPLVKHDLLSLWQGGRDWLIGRGYKIEQDARLATTDHLITAFHEIDPTGDLFRFGISRQSAFEKNKSYDRIGLNIEILSAEFEAAGGLLHHWEGALVRAIIMKEMEWDTDPYFDVDDFPRSVGDATA